MMTADHENEDKNPIAAAIDAAEEIPDPLDGLVEKSATNPRAAFMPEVLPLLAALKKQDRAAYESLRSQLKQSGCRIAELDRAIAKESSERDGRPSTQTDILIELAETADLFRNPDGTGFADLDLNGHRETWPIRGMGFRRWLAKCFWDKARGTPSSEVLQSALNVIEAKAQRRSLHLRPLRRRMAEPYLRAFAIRSLSLLRRRRSRTRPAASVWYRADRACVATFPLLAHPERPAKGGSHSRARSDGDRAANKHPRRFRQKRGRLMGSGASRYDGTKIKQRLGSDPGMVAHSCPKLTGMWQRTCERLRGNASDGGTWVDAVDEVLGTPA